MNELTYERLRAAIAGSHVALRCRVELQPAGGPGDKVFPPTYGVPDSAETKYATERRVVGDEVQNAALLDSVASQANRIELALAEALELGEIDFPNPYVDFTVDDDVADLGHLSALHASHRIADAVFRDSLLDGVLFRYTDVGHAITEATPNDATAMFLHNPIALLLGVWDSTGPKGGLGSKFQRSLVSEIVGFGVEPGKKVGSRIDQLQIDKGAGPVYASADPAEGWTTDADAAAKEKGKPKEVGKGGESGRPSQINHGNVTPSIDARAGGVTLESAVQLAVLSFAALRKLRFRRAADGTMLTGPIRRDAEVAARTAVAALGVAGLVYQHEYDYDLRSRCLLVPTAPVSFEFLGRHGEEPTLYQPSVDDARQLVSEAADAVDNVGLSWGEALRFEPTPRLIDLIKRSRQAAAAEAIGEDEDQ